MLLMRITCRKMLGILNIVSKEWRITIPTLTLIFPCIHDTSDEVGDYREPGGMSGIYEKAPICSVSSSLLLLGA
jgi:hypothetical protein